MYLKVSKYVLKFLIFLFLFEIKYFPGTPPSIEQPYGSYPLYVMNSKSNKTIPILQAYCNSKYIGKVNLKFDSNGDLRDISGSPILMDHKIKQGKLINYITCEFRLNHPKNKIIISKFAEYLLKLYNFITIKCIV